MSPELFLSFLLWSETPRRRGNLKRLSRCLGRRQKVCTGLNRSRKWKKMVRRGSWLAGAVGGDRTRVPRELQAHAAFGEAVMYRENSEGVLGGLATEIFL